MIKSLYPKFQEWSKFGSIYIISDTHFEDPDCKFMDPNWITPEEHMQIIKSTKMSTGDTLIHLGDVGNPNYIDELKCKNKILISGNHDILSKVASHFTEVYTGPLFIADRILLSHEPILGLEGFALNIHGHDHADTQRINHINLASNVYHYQVFNLGSMIKGGILADIPNYHRVTIDKATIKKERREDIDSFLESIKPLTEPFENIPEACRYCPTHPSNGGTGFCHCILGQPKITC